MSFFRNKSIYESLEKGNFVVREASTKPLNKNRSEITRRAILKWIWSVILSLLSLAFNPKKVKEVWSSDVCFFGYPSNLCFIEMAVVKHLFRKTVIFDPFIFLSDTIVEDRAYTSSKGVMRFLRLIDKCGSRASSVVLTDCSGHTEYLFRNFQVKGVTLHVGANDNLFFPGDRVAEESDNGVLRLYTHSTFIPLHGVECIIDAMLLLDKQKFHLTIAGFGQRFNEVSQKIEAHGLSNVTLLGMIPQEELRSEILACDLCLGIFGSSEKSKRVIPQKFFEFIACGRPVLTQSSRSYSSDLASAFHCSNDPRQLAAVLEKIHRSQDTLPQRGFELRKAYCAKYGLQARDFEIQQVFASSNRVIASSSVGRSIR